MSIGFAPLSGKKKRKERKGKEKRREEKKRTAIKRKLFLLVK